MNTIQTTLLYLALSCGIVSLLWACVRALRKRFAGEPCIGQPSQEMRDFAAHSLRRAEAAAKMDPKDLTFDFSPDKAKGRGDAGSFPAYIKALPDADLWAMKGLSAPLAKIRKTEMDVRRRRKARATAARRDVIGHTPDGRPVFVDHRGSLTLQDPAGWDANGSPAIDDNVQAALTE